MIRDYSFNRFNLRIDFQKQEVAIADDLEVSEEGACRVPLSFFMGFAQTPSH